MRTLSSPASAALTGPVQRPSILVQMDFSPVQRVSSRSTITWNGHTWTGADVRVENLRVDAFSVSGTLVLGNLDDVAGNLVLSQGAQDRAITLWSYDGGATGTADVVWLAAAVGAAAELTPREVRIQLRHRTEFMNSPRTQVNASAGFTQLLPAGTVMRINGIDYTLERAT
jgi:hypothetical protein